MTPIDHDTDELSAVVADARRLAAEARDLTDRTNDGDDDGALVPLSTARPEHVKTTAAVQRSALVRMGDELAAQKALLEEKFRRELDALRSVMEPLQQKVKRLEEMVWTVNLYLGRDEEIVTLADGDPAPADTPISVRQLVLSMDEETTIAAADGGIDFRDLDAFDAWITDPAHLHQVLPEPRGVVVLVPRRRGGNYGDTAFTAMANEENRRSYWLIRNGQRLFRMSTDFAVGDRLTPTREEFHSFFTESRYNHDLGRNERVPLEPGSYSWLRAEKAADARRRHYMRAALILQGLIDRTTVFHPLPQQGMSLLQPDAYEAGHVRLICDAENTLGSGRAPFYEWLAERNAQLRPGMRIVGAFTSSAFRDLRSRDNGSYGEHERLRPPKAESPPSHQIHLIEDRRDDDGALVIRYHRTEEVYTRGAYGHTEYRTPKVRASCSLYPSDRFILPIDLVTVEEMQQYLGARIERHAYLDLVPLLKAAIEVKQAEAHAEAPFRELLAGQISLAHDVDLTEAADAVPELVSWWKHTTVRHRPLVAGQEPDAEAAAIKQIVAEFGARRAAAAQAARDAARDTEITTRLREQIPDAMLIARTRDGGYLVLSPQPRRHPEPIAQPRVYVREHTTGRTATTLTTRDWIIPTRTRLARWTVLWSAPAWEEWDLDARPATNLTDPEIDTLITDLVEHGTTHRTVLYRREGYLTEPTGTPALMSCRAENSGRAALLLYLDHGDDLTLPSRRLTETLPTVAVRMLRLRWHRGLGGKVEREISEHAYDKGFDITTSTWRDIPPIRPPWHDQPVLWSEPDRVDRLHRQAEQVLAATRHATTLRETAHRFDRALVAGWETRAEQAAYVRFLEDYADPALWEGHRKTLKGLRYPHHQHRGLTRLINRLVEDGHDLTGHTVASALALLDEDLSVPEDTLDLTFTAPEPP